MLRYALMTVLLVCACTAAHAQERPGRWEKDQYLGSHESRSTAKDAEIARLEALVEQLNKKIALLEQKAGYLDAELKRMKEVKI
jgi:predicted type IV restriction endonuclease